MSAPPNTRDTDGEAYDSAVSGTCTTVLHSGNQLHPKKVSFLFVICCSRIVNPHPGHGENNLRLCHCRSPLHLNVVGARGLATAGSTCHPLQVRILPKCSSFDGVRTSRRPHRPASRWRSLGGFHLPSTVAGVTVGEGFVAVSVFLPGNLLVLI